MAKMTPCLTLGFVIFSSFGLASELKGVRPHASRTEYSVTCFTEDIGVGATLVAPEQVRRLFGAEIDENYIVVEVGFYSKNHGAFDVHHADFALRNRPSRTLVKPADPREIVNTLARPIEALIEKTLPEVSTTQAIAGYLFFPNTEHASLFELDYRGHGAWLTLPLK
jgi:hypothetical protein